MAVFRKQDPGTRNAILAAAVAIMARDGAGAVTPQRVALEAGVGRATVYRHWPDGAELIQAALEQVDFSPVEYDEGAIDERIRVELQRLANELTSLDTRRLLSILLERAERLRPAEDLRSHLVNTFVGNLEEALDDAVRNGELEAAPDPGELFDRLVGPLWSCRMLRGRPITDKLIDKVIDDALLPWRPASNHSHAAR